MKKFVEEAIENIRPSIVSDGGDIMIENIKKESITIKVIKPQNNTCANCFLSADIIKDMLESFIKTNTPNCPQIIINEVQSAK